MTISYNWLCQYIDTDISFDACCELLTDIGLEVEGTSSYQSVAGGLEGLVIGHVLSCEQHPDADRLSLTQVDIGGDAPLSIVCGAPNVAAGQKVVVAPVGATLYPKDADKPLKIKKGKIRGQVSEGMICAEDEIGLGASHAGILVLPEDLQTGMPAAEYFQVENDRLIEIGLTPNRADAMSHWGVALDLAAALEARGQRVALKVPESSACPTTLDSQARLPIKLEVLDSEKCPRYLGICLDGILVQESPQWLQHRLKAIGLEPINALVDISNYVQQELGQPLHCFDYDKIAGQTIRVRSLEEGTKFLALDEKEYSLSSEDLMICDAEDKPLCMAGVFGGLESGVQDTTKAIFLELAFFAPTTVRRSSMRHNLRTDAASRFEKGVDISAAEAVLRRALHLYIELTGAKIASPVYEFYPVEQQAAQVQLRRQRIPALLGINPSEEELQAILKALQFEILSDDGQSLLLRIPMRKPDVLREADVLEEILRIYGYNRIEMSDTLKSSLSFRPKPDMNAWKNRLADSLSAQGFFEIQCLSLSRSQYFKNSSYWPFTEEELVYVNNSSNVHLDLLRPSLVMGGLEVIAHNINRQQESMRLYEFGRSYHKNTEGEYSEPESLALWLTGKQHREHWLNSKPVALDFYSLKAYCQGLLERMGYDINSLRVESQEGQDFWAYSLDWKQGKQSLLRLGRINGLLLRELGIGQEVYYAEMPLEPHRRQLSKSRVKYKALPKHPLVERDMALLLDKDFPFDKLRLLVQKQFKGLLKNLELFDVYSNAEQLGEDKKSYALRLSLQHDERTLGEGEVDKQMEKLREACVQQLGAVLR